MTCRLYYDDPYLKEFDAVVEECVPTDDGFLLRLNQSAFYPTSGGQPYDTGDLSGAAVLDVFVDKDGEVWHKIDRSFEIGAAVHGRIDWERRFDHMQQHAGEHMLANAAWRILGGMTIGLHLGVDVSSIDMTLPEGKTHATEEELHALEDDVNSRIQRDVPIRQWFPSEEELTQLPLRKPPTVSEHVRVVQIGELEFCACGGTHPSSAGQIGLVKIVDARPSRGKLRLSFVCGQRAYRLLREHYELLHQTADMLSTSVSQLPTIVDNMNTQIKDLTRELAAAQKELLFQRADQMLSAAETAKDGTRVIAEIIRGDVNTVRELAVNLAQNENCAVILGADTGKNIAYVLCRNQSVSANMGAILSAAAKQCGGKGGGKPDFAQGGGTAEMLDVMKDEILSREK